MSGGLCEPSRGLVCGREWVAGHRAGARRSQDASHSALPGGTVSREWPGRDEHWLVRVIELVLDVPRKFDTVGGLEARHYRGVRCEGSGRGGTSTGSSAASSWCSTFAWNATVWEGTTLGITGECGVKGVAWEGRALARPHPRGGARRSQETRRSRRARRSALPGSAVSRE